MISILSQSKQNVLTDITAPSDPTGATVSFAFVGPYSDQQSAAVANVTSTTTYYTGSWVGQTANSTTKWTAEVLVGPGSSSLTFTSGVWVMFAKVAGSPEVPIVWCGYLEVS